jgi:hypothetical protein
MQMMKFSAAAVVAVAVAAAGVVNAGDPLADLVLLTKAAQQDGAVCLDGSPGAYYIQRGNGTGVNKWYVHHQGTCASEVVYAACPFF